MAKKNPKTHTINIITVGTGMPGRISSYIPRPSAKTQPAK